MAWSSGKQLKYVGNDSMGLNMLDISEISSKRLKYVGNDLDMWEMD